MLAELTISTVLVLVTVLFHGLGLGALSQMLHLGTRRERRKHADPLSLRGTAFTLVMVLGLFVLHGIEIWFYAFVYVLLEAIPDLRTAVYFSSITYATIGYDDDPLHQKWALIAAIEGINGILLLGWSTAFFMSVVTRLGHGPHDHSDRL